MNQRGNPPHFIIIRMVKPLPCDLFGSFQLRICVTEGYARIKLKVFENIHKQIQHMFLQSLTAIRSKEHKRTSPISFKEGDSVMIQTFKV